MFFANNIFNYLVQGNHPVFSRVDRKCLSMNEVGTVVKSLIELGYEVEVLDTPFPDGHPCGLHIGCQCHVKSACEGCGRKGMRSNRINIEQICK